METHWHVGSKTPYKVEVIEPKVPVSNGAYQYVYDRPTHTMKYQRIQELSIDKSLPSNHQVSQKSKVHCNNVKK
jgi:hypothetical protein